MYYGKLKIFEAAGMGHRECEVAMMVAKGLTNVQAAKALFICEKTIKFHLTNIYKKMKISSRAELIVRVLHSPDYTLNPALVTPPQAPTVVQEERPAHLPFGQM